MKRQIPEKAIEAFLTVANDASCFWCYAEDVKRQNGDVFVSLIARAGPPDRQREAYIRFSLLSLIQKRYGKRKPAKKKGAK